MIGRTAEQPPNPGNNVALARKIAVGIVIATAVLFLRAVIPNPFTRAFGDRVSEGPAHLWGLWTTAEHLFSFGPFFRTGAVNHPDSFAADLIDPVSLVVFWPIWLVLGGGPKAAVFAWNMLHVATVGLAGWGGWRLARRVIPDPVAALVVVATCAATPYLMASAQLGRSEYLAGAWYPLHLAFLHAHLSADRTRRDTLGAVATLVGLAHSGWTLALWVAALEIPVALAFSRQLERDRLRRLLEVALPSLLLSLPFLAAVLWLNPWWFNRLQPGGAMPVVLVMPLQNLVRFMTAFPVGGGLEVAPYPGTVVPVLIAVALWNRWRSAWPWALFAVTLGVLALGPEIQIAGPTGPVWRGYAPVAWAQSYISQLNAVQNWPRIAALMGAPLGLAAAWGVAVTGRRRPRHHLLLIGALAGLIVLDHVTWAPARTAPSFAVELPADQLNALAVVGDGAILELPVDNDQYPEYAVWEDFSLLWQLQHGHPTSEAPSPTRAAAYKHSVLAANLAVGARPVTDPCAGSERGRLRAAGFSGVLLQKRRVQATYAVSMQSAIQEVLGEPIYSDEQVAAWSVPEDAPDATGSCAAPLQRNIGRM